MSSADAWTEYWNREDFWGPLKLWELNASIFLRRAEGMLDLTKEDRVLDIGSGPGALALALADKVHSVLAVDSSRRFVEQTRERCRSLSNVEASLTGEDYTDLTVFDRRFSLFLCISVVQYYNDVAEVEALIRSAQKVALPKGRMLIADLNLRRGRLGFLVDALSSAWKSVQEGYMPALMRMAWKRWATSSAYRSAEASTYLLKFDYAGIGSLVERMGLKAEIIRSSLSIYANRPSLLIHF